jgi:hypothetical protein
MKMRGNKKSVKGGFIMGHEGVVSGPITERDLRFLREAVCIQTEKIYDSCKEKDCIENATVFFRRPEKIRKLLNTAINVKVSFAEIADVFADVEPVPFKRGFFTVDVKFLIKVALNFFVPKRGGGIKIVPVSGLVAFDKKVILFGSEGNVRIFKSRFKEREFDEQIVSELQQDNMPFAKVEVAEPIALNARIVDVAEECICINVDSLPHRILDWLDSNNGEVEADLIETDSERVFATREVQVTIGLFSIIKLVRVVQLLIPAFDFCVPSKNCIASTEDEPCDLFDTIEFPVDEFFPPQRFEFAGAEEDKGKSHRDAD